MNLRRGEQSFIRCEGFKDFKTACEYGFLSSLSNNFTEVYSEYHKVLKVWIKINDLIHHSEN